MRSNASLTLAPSRWPDLAGRLALLCAIAVTPFFQLPGSPPDEAQFKYLAALMGLMGIGVLLLGLGRRMRRLSAGALFVVAFGGWALLSCLWARDVLFSLREWTMLGAGLMIYALVVMNRLPTSRLLQPLLWGVLTIAVLNALFADLHFAFEKGPLAQTPLGPGLGRALGYGNPVLEGKRNIRALFGHPNFLSIYLVMALALTLALMAGPRRGLRPLPLLTLIVGLLVCWFLPGMKETTSFAAVMTDWRALLLAGTLGGTVALSAMLARWPALRRPALGLILFGIFAAVVVCRSRSGWLALALVLVVFALVGWRHRRVRLWQVAVLFALLAGAGLGVNHLRKAREARASWEEVASFNTATSRVYNFQLATRMVREKPLLGWGHGSFKTEYYHALDDQRLQPDDPDLYIVHLRETRGRPPLHVHNDFFETALETGVVGLGLFLLLMCWTGVRLLEIALASPATRMTWQALAIGGALLAMLSDMMLSFPLNLPMSGALFWLLVGLSHRLAQDHAERTLSPGG